MKDNNFYLQRQFIDETTIPLERVDEAADYTHTLFKHIQSLTAEWNRAKNLTATALHKKGLVEYTTPAGRKLWIRPSLARPLTALSKEEKEVLKLWAMDNDPSLVQVQNAHYLSLVKKGVELPVPNAIRYTNQVQMRWV